MPAGRVDVGFAVMTGEGFNERHVARRERLTDLVVEAERVGFDSVVLPDHLRWDMEQGPHGFRESTTLLAAFAALTSRVRLGTGVLNGPFRHPGLVAKIAVNLDEISGGRFILGVGAGGGPPVEYQSFGFPGDHHVARFEEGIRIIHALLRTGRCDFEGAYYTTSDCVLAPAGPRPGAIPIMIGGEGPRMMRVIARYADEWNGFLVWKKPTPEVVHPLLIRLDEACAALGRNPASVRRSVDIIAAPTGEIDHGLSYLDVPLHGRPEEMAEQIGAFGEVGIAEVRTYLYPQSLETVRAMEPVLKALDDLG
jgi:alkanesulfonate monooxygenase SsuD/methylene tetrahydromethanopterin reductase-like flavin-dependent oxidoreductase (luciferase family)